MQKLKLPKQNWVQTQNGYQLFDKVGKTKDERIEQLFSFMRERHLVYLRKSSGRPAPWTKDHILQNNRFCNVYREIDKVSEWVIDNIILPYEDSQFFPQMIFITRLLNKIETLEKIVGTKAWPSRKGWDYEDLMKALRKINETDTVFGAAYIISPGSIKSDDPIRRYKDSGYYKIAILCEKFFKVSWERKNEWFGDCCGGKKASTERAVKSMMKLPGMGGFIANQVSVDLQYSKKWLGLASDINTFNAAGPGTKRGVSWIRDGQLGGNYGQPDITEELKTWVEYGSGRYPELWPVTTNNPREGFAPLSMANVSNCACEGDKYFRVVSGSGEMKQKYNGLAVQQSLI